MMEQKQRTRLRNRTIPCVDIQIAIDVIKDVSHAGQILVALLCLLVWRGSMPELADKSGEWEPFYRSYIRTYLDRDVGVTSKTISEWTSILESVGQCCIICQCDKPFPLLVHNRNLYAAVFGAAKFCLVVGDGNFGAHAFCKDMVLVADLVADKVVGHRLGALLA